MPHLFQVPPHLLIMGRPFACGIPKNVKALSPLGDFVTQRFDVSNALPNFWQRGFHLK
jgi:hypothetical protein